MRDQVEDAVAAPYRDHEARKACTNSDLFREAVDQATRDDLELALDHPGAAIAADEAGDPACRHSHGVASAWVGGDGAALLSVASVSASWRTVIAESAPDRSAGTQRSLRRGAPADQAPVGARHAESPRRDHRSDRLDAGSPPEGREVRRRGWDRQAERRRRERKLRKGSLAFRRYARGRGWSTEETAEILLIDGVFPAILNVRDLASHQQLLWLAVAREDAATVTEALVNLFAEHGPPLVMKCDNGPAFRAWLTKRFLLTREVFTLYSPPYCAPYTGGCERANRTLKELTAHVADQAGRRDFWKSDDLLAARLRANRLSRPWGRRARRRKQPGRRATYCRWTNAKTCGNT